MARKNAHKEILRKVLNDKSFRQKAFRALALAILAGTVAKADAMDLIGRLGEPIANPGYLGNGPS